jgi:hypothetical protein
MLNKRSRVRGIGLLEIMLSLAIIALIIVMAARYFSVAQQQQKITQTMTMITTLIQEGRTYGAGSASPCDTFNTRLNPMLATAGLIPVGYGIEKPGPWGIVAIKGRASGGDLCQNFQIEIEGVPPAAFKIISDNIMNNQGSGSGLVDSVCGSGGVGC